MRRKARRRSPRSDARCGRAAETKLARGGGAQTLTTRDVTSRIATQIRADKKTLLSGEHAAKMRELLEQRGVLVFPKINFTHEERVGFTQTLGTFAREMR